MKIRTKSRRLGTVTTIALALWLWGVPAEQTLAEDGAVVLPMKGAGDAAAEDGVSLRVPGQACAVVDASEPTGRVDLFVTPEADLAALAPRLELPDGFVADPESGVAQDFSEPVTYTIEGDGERREWRVRVFQKRYSYALAFDGSSVIEQIGDHDTYRFIHHPAEFTVSMRLRIEDRANRQAIFRTGSSASGQHHGLKIEQHSDGSPLRVTIYGNGSSSRVTTEVPGDHVQPDTWHHLAVTGAGHDEPMTLYIDGERVDSTTIHTIDDEPQEYTLTLGGRYGGSSGFTGQLADVAIWNMPHSAEQIKQLAAEGVAAGQTDALVSHWPLNEVEGEAAHDVVGGHEGVIRDAAWATSFEVLDARAERSVTGLKRLMPEMPAGARQQIVDMLAASEDPAALQGLIAATSDESASVREAACRALAGWDEAEAVQAVVPLLEDASASVREAAFATLTDMGSSAVEPFAAVLMESDSADARQRAAMRLGWLGGNAAVEALGQALTDGEAKVRSAAVTSLSEHVAAGAAETATVRGALIERVHEDEVRSVRDTAARALARLGGDEAEAALVQAGYADWPMYRYDTSRRSVTPVGLGEALHLHWVREMPEPRRAWPRQQDDFEKLNFDKSYEPVVAGELMYVASMVSDSVKAYDINSGELRWRYRTDGPVRMAPLVWEGRVYAVADDGALHCVDAETGERIWWFQAAPTNRMVLGNERLISMWPGRGGPAIDDEGVLYFAAGIWPHEGVFIYAIDAETGEVEWANSGDASDAVVDSKRYYSFGGVAPQGQLVIAGDRLLVPGGRTAPAAFDRRTGEQLYFNIASHGTGKSAGGHEVFVHGEWFFNPRDRFLTHMYQVVDGAQYGSIHVDLATDRIFTGVDASGNRMYGYSPRIKPGGEGVPEPDQLVDRRGRPVGHARRDMAGRAPGIEGRMRRGALGGYYDVDLLWRTQIDGLQRLHLKAGDTV